MELLQLVQEGARLKAELDEIQSKLKMVNQEIYEKTTFEDKNTTTLSFGGITAKVQKKETYAWDQAKLDAARQIIGEEKFLNIFSFQWKPASKKKLDGFLEFASPEQKKPIMDALTIKPSFAVTYEVADV